MYNASWYGLKFSGAPMPFSAMTQHLKSYGHQGAYWRDAEFDGAGGWVVRKDILEQQADKFENFESRATIAWETYERKEIGK
jgi:hypothetical protein